MSLSSRRSQRSSPTSPCSAKAGARRRFDRKRALPRPPRPPSAGQPAVAGVHEVGEHGAVLVAHDRALGHRTPRGRRRRRPCLRCPCPWVPLLPARCGWSRKASSDATLRSATSQTSPPVPPSPPSGPPWARGPRAGSDRARAAVAALDVETTLVDELRHPVEASRAPAIRHRVGPVLSRWGSRTVTVTVPSPESAGTHGSVPPVIDGQVVGRPCCPCPGSR